MTIERKPHHVFPKGNKYGKLGEIKRKPTAITRIAKKNKGGQL